MLLIQGMRVAAPITLLAGRYRIHPGPLQRAAARVANTWATHFSSLGQLGQVHPSLPAQHLCDQMLVHHRRCGQRYSLHHHACQAAAQVFDGQISAWVSLPVCVSSTPSAGALKLLQRRSSTTQLLYSSSYTKRAHGSAQIGAGTTSDLSPQAPIKGHSNKRYYAPRHRIPPPEARLGRSCGQLNQVWTKTCCSPSTLGSVPLTPALQLAGSRQRRRLQILKQSRS